MIVPAGVARPCRRPVPGHRRDPDRGQRVLHDAPDEFGHRACTADPRHAAVGQRRYRQQIMISPMAGISRRRTTARPTPAAAMTLPPITVRPIATASASTSTRAIRTPMPRRIARPSRFRSAPSPYPNRRRKRRCNADTGRARRIFLSLISSSLHAWVSPSPARTIQNSLPRTVCPEQSAQNSLPRTVCRTTTTDRLAIRRSVID